MIDYILTLITVYPACASLIVFILGFLTDVVWANWAISVKKNSPIAAANLSVLIYIFGLMYTLVIIDKNLFLIFMYLLGGWLGTYLAVKQKGVI